MTDTIERVALFDWKDVPGQRYDTRRAETPLGRLEYAWKGWKDFDGRACYFRRGDYWEEMVGVADSNNEAEALLERWYFGLVQAALSALPPGSRWTAPDGTEMVAVPVEASREVTHRNNQSLVADNVWTAMLSAAGEE